VNKSTKLSGAWSVKDWSAAYESAGNILK